MNQTQNIKNFLNSKNVSMLWEVLLDELNINPNSSAILQNIKTVFDGNISLFTTKANPNMGLMNLNKLFLNQVLIAVNQLFPNLKQEQQMKLINISDEVIGEPYKVEDIHNARQTDFEKQVADKRNEFENSINQKKPQPVDFSDKVEPEMKIMEMEALIAETMAKRKFDIEQIQGLNSNVNANANSNSLTNNVINVKKTPSLQAKAEKTVSFNDNVTLHIDDYDYENVNNINNINNIKPDIQTSIFNKLKKTTPDTNLSELNNKIDTLVTMMEKIVLLLEKKENK